MEFLRPFCIVGAILGVHLIEPFVKLTSSKKTHYEDLKIAFPRLHVNLLNIDENEFFQFDRPAMDFVTPDTFNEVKYPEEIILSISQAIEHYRPQVGKR